MPDLDPAAEVMNLSGSIIVSDQSLENFQIYVPNGISQVVLDLPLHGLDRHVAV